MLWHVLVAKAAAGWAGAGAEPAGRPADAFRLSPRDIVGSLREDRGAGVPEARGAPIAGANAVLQARDRSTGWRWMFSSYGMTWEAAQAFCWARGARLPEPGQLETVRWENLDLPAGLKRGEGAAHPSWTSRVEHHTETLARYAQDRRPALWISYQGGLTVNLLEDGVREWRRLDTRVNVFRRLAVPGTSGYRVEHEVLTAAPDRAGAACLQGK